MRIPISWLKDYVDVNLSIEELARRMTMAGLEVTNVERVGEAWHPERIVVGEIVEVNPHPNADKLVIAMVDDGAGDTLTAITGAPNVRLGDRGLKVPFARLGAELIDPYTDEEGATFDVAPAEIRGVASEGVVCSERELGLSEDHEGILILEDDAPVGQPLRKWLGDTVLEIDILPNIARCLSMIGVAREIAALTGEELRLPSTEMMAEGSSIAGQIELEIEDPDLCPRYSATLIRDVEIGPSPRWMQRRLTSAGMRPINNIVDITNYVMLEWGQPLHAFDYDLLPEKRIVVRRAEPGERMTTLDGVDRTFTEDMLLITTGEAPVAVAGVMGGAETEVNESTRHVLLESANFDFINNRRTAAELKLQKSEASRRFGRGVDPESTVPAAKRASELMRQYAGGTVAQGVADAYPAPPETTHVSLTADEVARTLGIEISTDEVIEALERLTFECQRQNGAIAVTVPSHRLDISIPADLVEEVARMVGYDEIPTTLMKDSLPPQHRNRSLEREERARDVLVGCGLTEVVTYSMTNPESAAKLYLGDPPEVPYVRLENPISSERTVMRRTLRNGLLETLALNLKHRDRMVAFEVGRVYLPREDEQLPAEPRRVGIAITGPRDQVSWLDDEPAAMDFFDLKGIVEVLLDRLHVQGAVFEPAKHPTFHPGRVARLSVGGREVGVLGELHPQVGEAFDLPDQRVGLAELDLEALLETAGDAGYEPISRFPAVEQDIAVVVDKQVPAQRVAELVREAGGALLRDVALFDVYRGEQVPAGKKSLAYALSFQAPDRTLTDDQVADLQASIRRRLEEELGARLRER